MNFRVQGKLVITQDLHSFEWLGIGVVDSPMNQLTIVCVQLSDRNVENKSINIYVILLLSMEFYLLVISPSTMLQNFLLLLWLCASFYI